MQRLAVVTPSSYPDVLGMLSNTRLTTDAVQAALAIYPRSAVVGQAFEALVILQNRCDQPVPITLNISLPRKDAAGNRVNLFTTRDSVQTLLAAGEVGLFHIPITPLAPTPPTTYPIRVSVDARRPRNAKTIREPGQGRIAGSLPMSPHRLAILQNEVGFGAGAAGAGTRLLNTLNGAIEIKPGQVPAGASSAAPRYEILWDGRTFEDDQRKYAVLEARTRQFTNGLTRTRLYEPLIDETDRCFRAAGCALQPGEVIAISKLLAYTLEDGLELEEGFRVTEGRWFQRLAAHIDDTALLADDTRLLGPMYIPALHDATRLGFHMLARSFKDALGSPAEHLNQANRLVEALEGTGAVDMQHVYMPLVLAGLMLHAQIKASDEDLWGTLDEVHAAWQTRVAAGSLPPMPLVAKLIDDLLLREEEFLIRTRVPRH